MRCGVVLFAIAAAAACDSSGGGSGGSTSGGGSGSSAAIAANGSAAIATTATPAAGSAAPAHVAGALDVDLGSDTDEHGPTIGYAFQHRVPRLPAISADGALVAFVADDWSGMPDLPASDDGPFPALPSHLEIRALGAAGASVEQLPLVDGDMQMGSAGAWVPAADGKKLRAHAAAALARLHAGGFVSLVAQKIDRQSYDTKLSLAIDGMTLAADHADDSALAVELRDKAGHAIARDELHAYTMQEGNDECSYTPIVSGVYVDPAHTAVYVDVGEHYRDDCTTPEHHVLALPFAGRPIELAIGLAHRQFDDEPDTFTPDAVYFTESADGSPAEQPLRLIGDHLAGDDHITATLARDGQSAWTSELTTSTHLAQNSPGMDFDWRASDLVVKTPAGWRIAAAMLTQPIENAELDKAAKAGKQTPPPPLTTPPGAGSLLAAFTRLTTDGVDATAAANRDLVAIGSGPKERTVGGAAFARPWNAAWAKHVTVISAAARLAPSGTTGAVAARIALAKQGYREQLTMFCVFDQTAAGDWTLVHVHFGASP